MDIEGYEYPVLHSIIDSGENFPLQIAMELHIGGNMNIGPQRRRMYPAELIAFMNYLRVFGGYYLVNRRDACGHYTEIVVAMLDCQQQQHKKKKRALDKNPLKELKELMKYNALFEDSPVQKYLLTRGGQ